MKHLLLILPILFFMTACEDVDSLNASNTAKAFSKIENKLYVYSEDSKDYLVIENVDDLANTVEVYTYTDSAGRGRTNELSSLYYCDTDVCKTKEIDSSFYGIEIESVEGEKEIVINGFDVRPDGTTRQRSSSRYLPIED